MLRKQTGRQVFHCVGSWKSVSIVLRDFFFLFVFHRNTSERICYSRDADFTCVFKNASPSGSVNIPQRVFDQYWSGLGFSQEKFYGKDEVRQKCRTAQFMTICGFQETFIKRIADFIFTHPSNVSCTYHPSLLEFLSDNHCPYSPTTTNLSGTSTESCAQFVPKRISRYVTSPVLKTRLHILKFRTFAKTGYERKNCWQKRRKKSCKISVISQREPKCFTSYTCVYDELVNVQKTKK